MLPSMRWDLVLATLSVGATAYHATLDEIRLRGERPTAVAEVPAPPKPQPAGWLWVDVECDGKTCKTTQTQPIVHNKKDALVAPMYSPSYTSLPQH